MMPRIGVVGLGGIAQKAYLPILANLKNVELLLQTRDEKVLNQLMATYHVAFGTTDFTTLVEAKPDAVFVCAATEAHYGLTYALLDAGIPVHLDKPISMILEESQALVELSMHRKVPFMVGFNRRFVPYVAEALTKGRPDFVLYQKHRFMHPDSIRRFVSDDFIHVIDTARFMLQAPIEGFHVHGNFRKDKMRSISLTLTTKYNYAVCMMDYENGRNEETIEVVFKNEKAIIRQLSSLEWVQSNQTLLPTQSDWTPTLAKRGFETMIKAFIEAVEHQGKVPIEAKDALQSHELAEAIILACEALVQKKQ